MTSQYDPRKGKRKPYLHRVPNGSPTQGIACHCFLWCFLSWKAKSLFDAFPTPSPFYCHTPPVLERTGFLQILFLSRTLTQNSMTRLQVYVNNEQNKICQARFTVTEARLLPCWDFSFRMIIITGHLFSFILEEVPI